jgi:hypothetical protein
MTIPFDIYQEDIAKDAVSSIFNKIDCFWTEPEGVLFIGYPQKPDDIHVATVEALKHPSFHLPALIDHDFIDTYLLSGDLAVIVSVSLNTEDMDMRVSVLDRSTGIVMIRLGNWLDTDFLSQGLALSDSNTRSGDPLPMDLNCKMLYFTNPEIPPNKVGLSKKRLINMLADLEAVNLSHYSGGQVVASNPDFESLG